MKTKKKTFSLMGLAGLIFLIIITHIGCSGKTEPVSKESFYFDTVCTITVYDMKDMSKENAEAAITKAFKASAELEDKLSKTKENSEIGQLNKNGEGTLSEISAIPLERGIYYGDISKGAFDITVGKVTDLWDFHGENPKVPEKSLVEDALKSVGYKDISVEKNSDGSAKVTLNKPGMEIDLGGIAKGYIADLLTKDLEKEGVTSAIINLGGNIAVIGEKPEGKSFKIGIEKPYSDRQDIVGSVNMKNQTIVTSGIYERFFEADGVKYHHIIDPTTGFPVESDIEGVSIISDLGSSMECDGLSTTCLLLGSEKAKELIDNTKGVEALFILKDGTIIPTKGFKLNK